MMKAQLLEEFIKSLEELKKFGEFLKKHEGQSLIELLHQIGFVSSSNGDAGIICVRDNIEIQVPCSIVKIDGEVKHTINPFSYLSKIKDLIDKYDIKY